MIKTNRHIIMILFLLFSSGGLSSQTRINVEKIPTFLAEEYEVNLKERSDNIILFLPLRGCPGVLEYLMNYMINNELHENTIVIISSNFVTDTVDIQKILKKNSNVYWDNSNKISYSNLGILIPQIVFIKSLEVIDTKTVTGSNLNEIVSLL